MTLSSLNKFFIAD